MASYWQKAILVSLIVAIVAVPTSTAHRRRWRRSRHSNSDDSEKYLSDLCSDSENPDSCWNIIKPSLRRFKTSGDREIADGVIHLARAKSEEIRDKLKQWHRDSNDENLKNKYYLCSENYNDVDRSLEKALKNLGSDDHRRIWDQIDESQHELEECKTQFGPGSFDPGHVEDRNNELRFYLDVVRAAAERLEDYYVGHDYRHLH